MVFGAAVATDTTGVRDPRAFPIACPAWLDLFVRRHPTKPPSTKTMSPIQWPAFIALLNPHKNKLAVAPRRARQKQIHQRLNAFMGHDLICGAEFTHSTMTTKTLR
jgi:hypothetical protein